MVNGYRKLCSPETHLAWLLSSSLNTCTVSVLEEQARKVPHGEKDSEKMEAVRLMPRRSSYSFAPSLDQSELSIVALHQSQLTWCRTP